MLYRLFPYRPEAGPRDEGGPLYVPRVYQGAGRHDNPDRYGAMYASREPVSVVAELLWRFRDRPVTEVFLRWEGLPYALARLDDSALPGLLDLDDPRNLAARGLRPSGVATRDRERTQPLAVALYDEGLPGFEWWSTLEASWINVTLFADRAVGRLRPAAVPEPLSLDHPAVREAAELSGVRLAGPY